MSYEGSTFIGKLEELSLSGLPLELVVVVGGCTVVAAALTGIASSLHSSRRQWREWKETDGNYGRQRGSSGRHCILSIICKIRRRCFVDGNEFGKKGGATAGGVCCSEIEVQHREWSKWEAITREMDRQTVLPNSSALTVD